MQTLFSLADMRKCLFFLQMNAKYLTLFDKSIKFFFHMITLLSNVQLEYEPSFHLFLFLQISTE